MTTLPDQAATYAAERTTPPIFLMAGKWSPVAADLIQALREAA